MSERLNFHSQGTDSQGPDLQEPLPPELAELEARLSQLPLPASTVNRDEVLYRAGWAAAKAICSHQPRRTVAHWLWPATSAALAATVLVVLFVPRVNRVKTPVVEKASSSEARFVTSKSTIGQRSTMAQSDSKHPVSRGDPALGLSSDSAYFESSLSRLTLRNRRLFRPFDTPPVEMTYDDEPSTTGITARELMRELLPEWEQPTDQEIRRPKHRNWPKQLWEAFS